MRTRKRPIARQRGEPTLHHPERCACGRPRDAGWTAARPQRHTRCLICETAETMSGFVWPLKREVQ